MDNYDIATVSEAALEDLVRRYSDKLEVGLRYITSQKKVSGGRLDVLFADSGNTLVVAELKVVEEDDMLMQAVDYYDDVAKNLEQYARLLSSQKIDPNQKPRILLIAPSFSQQLLNRIKWISAPISLFRFQVISIRGEIVPVFFEERVEATPVSVEEFASIDEHLSFIKDRASLARAERLIKDFQSIDSEKVTKNPVKNAISFKYAGTVFAYFYPRRQFFVLGTYNKDDDWTTYRVATDDDLKSACDLAVKYVEKLQSPT